MITIFNDFLMGIISGGNGAMSSNLSKLSTLADHVFYIDNYIGDTTQMDFFSGMTSVIYDIALWLLIIKFLRNGFETYISWTGGDPDSDPMNMIARFVKAVVLTIIFPVLYELYARICISFLNAILSSGSISLSDKSDLLTKIAGAATWPIANFAFWVCFLILYFQLLKRGAELLVLRLCFPFACVGLLDSDNGAYAPYLMMIFKTGMTTIVQIVLFQLSYTLISSFDIIIGFVFMALAISAPKLLQQFMIPTSGGGVAGKALSIARVTEVAVKAVA